MLVLQVLAAAVAFYYLYQWLIFRLKYDVHKLPSPPRLPIIGHLLHFAKMKSLNQNKWYREWYYKLGKPKIMLRSVPGDDALIIFDPEYVKNTVLGRNGFPRAQVYKRINKMWVGPHGRDVSLTAKNPTPFSQAIRKAIAQSFTSTHVRHAFPKIMMVLENAVERIRKEAKEGPVDLQLLFGHMAADLVGRVGFDLNFGGIDRTGRIFECFVNAFGHLTDTIFKPHLQIYMKLFPNSEPAQRKKRDQEEIFGRHKDVSVTIMSREYPKDDEHSLWANIRRMIDPDTGNPVDPHKLAGEVVSMVGAAMDTTGHQLGWIFAVLSDMPEVTQRIRDDMTEIGLYGPDRREVEFADISKMPYLTAVVKECMRTVTSLAAVGARCIPRDMEVFGYRLPKDMQVYLPMNVFNQLEEFFEDHDKFKPERWMDGNQKDYHLPFSYGPRDCVGQRLGMLEMQLTIIYLLQQFDIKLAYGKTYEDIMETTYYESVMCASKGGLFFDITAK